MAKEHILDHSFGRQILTQRQRETLGFVGMGFTNARIASQLNIAKSTVAKHLECAASRLEGIKLIGKEHRYWCDAKRTTSLIAAVVAAEHGLIPPLPSDALLRYETLIYGLNGQVFRCNE